MNAAIVERVIRTLKEKLFKYFSLNGTYKFVDILPEIIENDNGRKHRTINMHPYDVNKNNEAKILQLAYNHLNASMTFRVGDIVRNSREKHVFKKGYTPNWAKESF